MRQRVATDVPELESLGIHPSGWFTSQAGLHFEFFAVDRANAERLLTDRYGPDIVLDWSGPSRVGA